MILVKMRGGLSNQMFQYAAARRLAAARSTSVRIDTSWYDNIPAGATARSFELHKLQISGMKASRWETIGTDGVRNARFLEIPVAIYRKARPRYRFITEPHFHFDPEVLALTDNVCLFGYWMSEKYFADAADIIRREFQFRNAPSSDNEMWIRHLRETTSVSLHIRRGDYASDPRIAQIFGQCSIDYYLRCMRRMREITRDPVFFVFSDDLGWAKDNLPKDQDTYFVDSNTGTDSHEDLRLMSAASHHIIANSSFSWWGAWLNPSVTKIICAPNRWLVTDAHDARDVVPPGWLRF